jgi:hypothetical protein
MNNPTTKQWADALAEVVRLVPAEVREQVLNALLEKERIDIPSKSPVRESLITGKGEKPTHLTAVQKRAMAATI